MTTTKLELKTKAATSAMPPHTIFKTYEETFEMNTVLGVRTYRTLELAEQMKQFCIELEQHLKEQGEQ